MTLKSKAPLPQAPPLPPPNNTTSHSPALKPVNIVKPTTDEQLVLPGGPKTSTPIKANQSIQSFSYISDGCSPATASGDEHASNFHPSLQHHQFSNSQIPPALPPPNDWSSSSSSALFNNRNGRSNQISNNNHNNNGSSNTINNTNMGKSKPLVDARVVQYTGNTNNGNVPRVRLATVRPQRIASVSGGSYRPFRMPEAPKILFRSVRGKSSGGGNFHNVRSANNWPHVQSAASLGVPDNNPSHLIPVISKNLSRSSKDMYKAQQDLSVDTNLCSSAASAASLYNNPASPYGYQHHNQYLENTTTDSTVSQSLLPQNSDELEAITLANTIANKNANKISPISSYSPNHHYATISPPTTPGGTNVVMGTTALTKRVAAAAAASSSHPSYPAPTINTTSSSSSLTTTSNNRVKPPISSKPMSIIPPPTMSSTSTTSSTSCSSTSTGGSVGTRQLLAAAVSSSKADSHRQADSSSSSSTNWLKSSVGNQKGEKKRKSSKKSKSKGTSKHSNSQHYQKDIELSSIPPPLIGNKRIPPPPMLDDDEDEEETQCMGSDNNGGGSKTRSSSTSSSASTTNAALPMVMTMERNGNGGHDSGGNVSSSNDDNNNLTVDEDEDEDEEDVMENDDEKQWLTTDKTPLPAPRIQAKNSKHVYQNIPFTKKTPLHEV